MKLTEEYREEIPKKKKRKRKKKKTNILKYLLLMVLGVLFVAYLAVAVFFMSHYAFNTYINGDLAQFKTVSDMQKDVVATSSKYMLTVYGRNDVQDIISSADVSLTPEFDGEFEEILKQQNSFLWPLFYFKETEYTTDTVVGYSKQDLKSLVNNLAFFKAENIEEPQDAYLSPDAGEAGFDIVPETAGCKPIKEKVYQEIEAAVDVLLDEVTLTDDCYDTASIKSDDPSLTTIQGKLNEFCNVNVIYEFDNEAEVVNGNVIKDWLNEDESGEYSLNEEKAREFVNSMARRHDTFGKERELVTHEGETIKIEGGDYGWWMDRASTTAELLDAIRNHENGVKTPVYFGTAASYGANDYGDTYVEIDLTMQHLWVYEEGKVVEESDFVSGNVNKGNGTPRGAYAITYKERDATLNGENYSSPVEYWMPFNGNVGMHDASWRKEFGGEIYLTNGSHGCINLPTKKAAAIYDIVKKREPVLVYGGKEPPPKDEETGEILTPEQQLQLLIDAGLLNADGTIPEAPPAPVQESE